MKPFMSVLMTAPTTSISRPASCPRRARSAAPPSPAPGGWPWSRIPMWVPFTEKRSCPAWPGPAFRRNWSLSPRRRVLQMPEHAQGVYTTPSRLRGSPAPTAWWPWGAAWWAIWRASPRPPSCVAWTSYRFPPHFWPRWTPPWGGQGGHRPPGRQEPGRRLLAAPAGSHGPRVPPYTG